MANGKDIDLNKLLANLILGSAKIAPKTPSPVGVGGALAKDSGVQSLMRSLAKISPTAIGSAFAAEDTLPTTEKPKPGPNEKLTQGAIDKRKKAQIEEALNAGGASQVLQKAVAMDKQAQTTQALGGAGQPQQQQTDQGLDLLSRLGVALGAGLTRAGGGDPSSILALASKRLDSQAALAKERRQATAPLSRSEREKIQLKSAVDIQKALATKGLEGLKPKQASDFSLLLEGRDATVTLDGLLSDNISAQLFAQGIPNFLKSSQGKAFQSTLEIMIQDKTRIETGAALQPSELKSTAKRFAPQAGDSLSDARRRLAPLFDFFNRSLSIADPTGIHRQRANQSRQSFLSRKANSIKVTSVREVPSA